MQLISALWFHYFSFCWFTLFRDLHYKNTWMYLNVTVIVMAQDLNQGSQLFCQRDSPETELKLWRSLKQNYQTQIRLSSSYKIQSESIKKNKCKSMLIFEKLLTKWREAFLVTWLGRIPADGDVCWRYGWCTKLCYRLKIIRGTDWMFELISGFSLEWTNIQESATVAYCCHYQWVRGCKSDDKVMTWQLFFQLNRLWSSQQSLPRTMKILWETWTCGENLSDCMFVFCIIWCFF